MGSSIEKLNPDITLYDTDCTIGTAKGVISPEKYKTMLMHKKYGHPTSPFSTSDIVILNPSDVKNIDDPINLKYGDQWLPSDYIFEFGTEKSAKSDKEFGKHLNSDLMKVANAKKQGYLIHIQRNYYTSGGDIKNRNERKYEDYLLSLKNVIVAFNNNKNGAVSPQPKIIFIVIDIGGKGREVRGKIRILQDPYNNCELTRINLENISNTLESLIF